MLAQRRVDTRQKARTLTIPAPIGGLNGRDSLAAMGPKDAFVLDNWVPGTATVDGRNGNKAHATGIVSPVESLIAYNGGASRKLLSFAGGNIHNVTVPGAVGVALQSGRNSNKIISSMFSNAGSQFLIGVSGLDVPFSYDGTTVTNLTMTGMTGSAANLSYVFGFKGRLYFAQKDQLGFYYLAVGAIQGALSYFDLSQIAKLGGYLVAIASFSADSGNGPADYIVFITSMGEYIVYAGFDPSSASNFGLVGRYYSAPPIGRNCTVNYGSDLVILTLEGALPFSAIRREGGITEDDAITYKLGRYLLEQNIYADVHGWKATLYPRGGMLLINVPDTASIAGAYVQFVQNTTTKAWTRFTNLNGISWCEFNGRIYFGTYNGRVMLADEGKLDDGQPIQLECKQAYNYFDDGYGSGPSNKHFHFAKLLLGCDGTPPISAQFNVDYMEDQPEFIISPPDETGSAWDISTWDLASWGTDVTTRFVMVSMGKYGVAGSLWVRASLKGLSLKWYATQYIFSKAAGVL